MYRVVERSLSTYQIVYRSLRITGALLVVLSGPARAVAPSLVHDPLPEPVRQHRASIRGSNYRPDLSYPDRKIAIELEGQAAHWGQWQYDHDRDNDFELDGWRVLTYTWNDANSGSPKLVMQVGEILGLRPTRWSAR